MPEVSTAVREESLYSFNHIPARLEIRRWLNPLKYKEEHLQPVKSYPDLPFAYPLKGRRARRRQDFLRIPAGSGPYLARFLSDTA